MPLHFAAITPHCPLLLPTIGKEALDTLAATNQAIDQLEAELYAAKPQIVIVISPHTGMFEECFTMAADPAHTASLEQFGDLVTKHEWRGATHLAAKIYAAARPQRLPIRQISDEPLDHGSAIPLLRLTTKLDAAVLPIGYSDLSPEMHLRFGALLADVIHDSKERIAVIVAGDLSHGIDKEPALKSLDKEIRDALAARDSHLLANISGAQLAASGECAYRSLLILMGMLGERKPTYTELAYEHPFGVGFLTAHIDV